MIKRQNRNPQIRQHIQGMSLPEILAGVLIGLIGMVVIMQVYTASEERKRTTTGTSDAQINGNIATFSLQGAIRSAGFGLVSPNSSMVGCTTVAYNSDRATPDYNFLMAPVVIAPGGTDFDPATGVPVGVPDGTSDQIRVIYGSSPTLVEGVKLADSSVLGANFSVDNGGAGFQKGDLVVASQAGINCTLAEVTEVVGASLTRATAVAYSYEIGLPPTTLVINRTSTQNKGGGSGVDYTADARLFSLGRTPVLVTYLVGNDKLQSKMLIPYVAAQDMDGDGTMDADIGDAIVQLKALYGKDTSAPPDGVPDLWDATPANWQQIIAVRIALLARSAKLEKTVVTVDPPTWNGGTDFAMVDLADGTDWHQYRYRVYETVIPLRNMIWSQ